MLSTASALLELIQVLGSRSAKEIVQGNDEIVGNEETLRTSSMKPEQLRVFLGWVSESEEVENEEHVLLSLWKMLRDVGSEEDNGDLARQFEVVLSLVKSMQTDEEQPVEDVQGCCHPHDCCDFIFTLLFVLH